MTPERRVAWLLAGYLALYILLEYRTENQGKANMKAFIVRNMLQAGSYIFYTKLNNFENPSCISQNNEGTILISSFATSFVFYLHLVVQISLLLLRCYKISTDNSRTLYIPLTMIVDCISAG